MAVNQNILGMPNWDKTVAMALQVVSEKESWNRVALKKEVADRFHLDNDIRYRNYPKHPDKNILESRVSWALSDLAIGGVVKRPRRGIYQITPFGKKILAKFGLKLTMDQIGNLPLYREHQREVEERRKRERSNVTVKSADTAEVGDVSDSLANKTKNYNIEVKTELLRRIMDSEPVFFEHLVVKLLAKMGYKGPNGQAIVTPISDDGGIDGIINQDPLGTNQDPLGTNTVYIQAKRYAKDNRVQRPQIQSFYGAIKGKGAESGVFITTSDFSDSAKKYADNFQIVLVDGIQLTDLMLEYEVGVQVKCEYKLYEIDGDFFDE